MMAVGNTEKMLGSNISNSLDIREGIKIVEKKNKKNEQLRRE
jgi:hypothetical protein